MSLRGNAALSLPKRKRRSNLSISEEIATAGERRLAMTFVKSEQNRQRQDSSGVAGVALN